MKCLRFSGGVYRNFSACLDFTAETTDLLSCLSNKNTLRIGGSFFWISQFRRRLIA